MSSRVRAIIDGNTRQLQTYCLLVVGAWGLGAILISLQNALLPLLFALFLSLLFTPMMNWLMGKSRKGCMQRHKTCRGRAVEVLAGCGTSRPARMWRGCVRTSVDFVVVGRVPKGFAILAVVGVIFGVLAVVGLLVQASIEGLLADGEKYERRFNEVLGDAVAYANSMGFDVTEEEAMDAAVEYIVTAAVTYIGSAIPSMLAYTFLTLGFLLFILVAVKSPIITAYAKPQRTQVDGPGKGGMMSRAKWRSWTKGIHLSSGGLLRRRLWPSSKHVQSLAASQESTTDEAPTVAIVPPLPPMVGVGHSRSKSASIGSRGLHGADPGMHLSASADALTGMGPLASARTVRFASTGGLSSSLGGPISAQGLALDIGDVVGHDDSASDGDSDEDNTQTAREVLRTLGRSMRHFGRTVYNRGSENDLPSTVHEGQDTDGEGEGEARRSPSAPGSPVGGTANPMDATNRTTWTAPNLNTPHATSRLRSGAPDDAASTTSSGARDARSPRTSVVQIAELQDLHAAAERRRQRLREKAKSSVRHYIVVKTVLSLMTAVLAGLILWIFKAPIPAMFALITFFLNYIPSIGSIISTLLPIPFILFDPDQTYLSVVLCIGLTALVQTSIGDVLEPILLGKLCQVHPIVVLLSLLLFSYIWGIPGMILAMPIIITMKLVCKQFNHPIPRYIAGLIYGDMYRYVRSLDHDVQEMLTYQEQLTRKVTLDRMMNEHKHLLDETIGEECDGEEVCALEDEGSGGEKELSEEGKEGGGDHADGTEVVVNSSEGSGREEIHSGSKAPSRSVSSEAATASLPSTLRSSPVLHGSGGSIGSPIAAVRRRSSTVVGSIGSTDESGAGPKKSRRANIRAAIEAAAEAEARRIVDERHGISGGWDGVSRGRSMTSSSIFDATPASLVDAAPSLPSLPGSRGRSRAGTGDELMIGRQSSHLGSRDLSEEVQGILADKRSRVGSDNHSTARD